MPNPATFPSQLPELAPIREMLEDPEVSDILVNSPNEVFVEYEGKLALTTVKFPDEAAVRALAEAICKAVGKALDPLRPLVDTRLADGSRVNIIAPPLAVDGTVISIRKFRPTGITLDDMVASGNISDKLAEFLKICVRCRMNILISGGTGSGKTTLLNAISQYIGDGERVVTIEDAAELRLQKQHVVRLETRLPLPGEPADAEVNTRDLVRNALRMRPDRIIIGEVRGAEAFDMMQAMNSGHEGSLTTIHANHPRDAISRLENMMNITSLGMPIRVTRAQIASALHLVIQISRMQDGTRRITFVTEIAGMEGDVVTMQDVFQFIQREEREGKITGEWKFTGAVARLVRRIAYWGEQERFAQTFGMRL